MRAVVPEELIEEQRRLGLEDVTDRGIAGRAVLGVEVQSTRDESYGKLPLYRRVGVGELLYVDPGTRVLEGCRPDGGGWSLGGAGDDGWTALAGLGVGLRAVGGRLQVRTDAGIEEV